MGEKWIGQLDESLLKIAMEQSDLKVEYKTPRVLFLIKMNNLQNWRALLEFRKSHAGDEIAGWNLKREYDLSIVGKWFCLFILLFYVGNREINK